MLRHTVGALPIGFFGCTIKAIALLNLVGQLRGFFGGLLSSILVRG